jgi:hypothetical protein
MTFSLPALQQPLVLVASGPAAAVAALQQQAGPPLAAALGLPWRAPLPVLGPDQALASLEGQAGGLVPLPLDPGLSLAGGGSWAEALGAWRQPVLLVFTGDQLQTGLPAAMVALLRQWQVPLTGLVQWGGRWDPEARRADGLPWLGGLGSDETDGEGVALRSALALRWLQIAGD